jgi:hypothetical protein
MSLGESINQDSPPPTTARHFLIVPSFNFERRHSWGNVISDISAPKHNITNTCTLR